MKKYIAGGAALIALVLVVAFIGFRFVGDQRGQRAAVGASTRIPIGFIAPLTGPFADWGESIRRGMELAVEDTRHSFDVDYQDDACDTTKGVSIGTSMLTFQKIKLIIGPGCSDVLRALSPLADEHKALMFSTGLLEDASFEGHTSVMNFATQISTEADYIAAYLKREGRKNIAFVHGTNAFGVEFGRSFPPAAHNNKMSIVIDEATDIEETDFRTVALKIVKAHPDAVFIHQGEKQIGLLAKQLRQLGYDGALYAYYGAESPSALAAGGSALEGLRYTYPVGSDDNDTALTEFNKRYAEKYGEDAKPTATSLFVYDGMQILDQALDHCEAADTACIKKYFVTLGDYQGLSGSMHFNEDGSITRPFGIKKIQGGEFVWITKDISL